jgi:hypothetical protein
MDSDTNLIKVIFKTEKVKSPPGFELVGFLPEFSANRGRMFCVETDGSSGEASLDCFHKLKTVGKNPPPDVMAEIRNWIEMNIEPEQQVKQVYRDRAEYVAQRYEHLYYNRG